MSNQQNTVLVISNLHKSVTEEILWQKFSQMAQVQQIKVPRTTNGKSKGYAIVTFQSSTDSKNVMDTFNYQFLHDKEQIPYKLQKKIQISYQKSKDQLQKLKDKTLIIKGIPKDDEEAKNISNLHKFLTQFGEVHKLNVVQNPKKDFQNSGYAYVQFTTEDSYNNLTDKKYCDDHKESFKFLDKKYDLTFEKFDNKQQQDEKIVNYHITCFADYTKFSDNAEEIKKNLEQDKQELQQFFSQYGTIQNIIISYNDQHKAPYAFCAFEKADLKKDGDSYLLETDIKNNKISNQRFINMKVSQIQGKQKHAQKDEYKAFHLKNVAWKNEEGFGDKLEESLKKHLEENYGKVTHIKVKKGTPPQGKEFGDAAFCIFVFDSSDIGHKFLFNYFSNKDFKKFFNKEQSEGNVTINLTKQDREKMVRNKKAQSEKIVQAQQQQAPGQMMNLQQYPMAPLQFMQMAAGQQNPMFQRQNQYHQHHPPMQGQRQFHNNMGQYQNKQRYHQQNKGQMVNQPPRKVNQNQEQQFATLQQLKDNLTSFNELTQEKQSQILGNLIFPKVQNQIGQNNEQKDLAPKITGMLIDFSVFDVADIIEILENDKDLEDRVVEAIELIKQQQTQQVAE